MGTVVFDVECGDWTLLCAKDAQHTLSDTVDMVIVGDEFVTDDTSSRVRGLISPYIFDLTPPHPLLGVVGAPSLSPGPLLLMAGDSDDDNAVGPLDLSLLVATFLDAVPVIVPTATSVTTAGSGGTSSWPTASRLAAGYR